MYERQAGDVRMGRRRVRVKQSKHVVFAMGIAVLMVSGFWATSAEAAPLLTPVQAYTQALQQAPQMVESRAQVAEAHGAVREAKGHLLPTLNLSVTASGSNNPLNVLGMKLQQRRATFNDFGAGAFTGPATLSIAPNNLNHPAWYRNYQTQAQLVVPVYNGGQTWAALHQASAMLAAAMQGEVFARQRLLFEVIRLYVGVGTARDYQRAALKGRKAAEAYVTLARKLYQQGVVDKTDVLRAQVHLDDARLALAQARKQWVVSREGLHILLGVPAGRPLHLAASDAVSITLPAGGAVVPLQNAAIVGNPGLQALSARVRAAQAGVSSARAAYLPHFNIVLSRQWNDTTLHLANASTTVAGVLSWDVFDLGSRRGAMDRATARVIRRQGALRQARDTLRLRVQTAWQEVQLAHTRIQLKQSSVADASEATRLAKLRYEKGVTTFTQLLAARAELDKSRADLVGAQYQEVMARASLLLALGRLQPQAVSLRTTKHQP